MNHKIIYEQSPKYCNKINIKFPDRIITKEDADNIIKEYGVHKICGIALKYYYSIFNYHNWKEITYFDEFANKLLTELPDKSILICPGCSPTKIIWLFNNLYRVDNNKYKCSDNRIKEFIFVQFPLSNLFSSSSFYDNKDHIIDLTKLDDYIKEVMEPYMKYLSTDYKLYYLDAMISGRTHKLLSASFAKINISQQLQPINIIPFNNQPKTIEEKDKVYAIRNFVGNDNDRIIEKYDVFNKSKQPYNFKNGNLSLLIYYIAHLDPLIINIEIKGNPLPKLENGKIYELCYKNNDIYKFKLFNSTDHYLECIYYSYTNGFYHGFLDSNGITKLYECNVTVNCEDYKDTILKHFEKTIEGNKLIQDKLLEFAVSLGYYKVPSTAMA